MSDVTSEVYDHYIYEIGHIKNKRSKAARSYIRAVRLHISGLRYTALKSRGTKGLYSICMKEANRLEKDLGRVL